MPVKRRQFFRDLGLGTIVLWSSAGPAAGAVQSRSPASHPASSRQLFAHRKLETDVVVAGGGLAGVCAALAAARSGSSVVLIQNRSRLGGNSSSEIRMHALGANNPNILRLWRETGLIEELKLTDAATNLQRSFAMWDLMLYDKLISEKRIDLMLDTSVIDARVRRQKLVSAIAVCPLVEESYEICAPFFIDCTGDATLAAAAGARYRCGREGSDTLGESLAPAVGDQKTMGNTILFFARKQDRPMPFVAPAWARVFKTPDFKHRPIHSWEYGYWWIEWGGSLDTIRDNQKIRHELLRCVLGIWGYIKNSGEHPSSSHWALDWIGMIPGKRENRRIEGDYILRQNDLVEARLFEDRVAYGGWPIDDHPPGGIDLTDAPPTRYIHLKQPYSIPLRCLYSVNRPNLLMAGRDISASHVAFASTRVMATCATMGQAAGTAAAFCLQNDLMPHDLAQNTEMMARYQQHLLRDDQSLLQVRNEDPDDLARSARVAASAETQEGPATLVIDGWNRDIGDGLTHQWRAPMQPSAPWIELRWNKPRKIRQVQLTLDTGLHRRLYLSGQDNEYYSQVRGPQPETAADFQVQAETGGQFTSVAVVKNNILRLVRLQFSGVVTAALRIQVTRTQADPLARIFEIRCYS
jgi:hypothetical protein